MTNTLQRPDGTIGYDDSGGDGSPVIAAPGMGDLRQSYRHLRPELSERGIRLVTMDLRGLGDSSVEWPAYTDGTAASDMLALAKELDAGPVVLVGNSMTASSAVIAATDEPDAVAGIVLLGPFAREVPTPGWQTMLFNVMLTPPWGKAMWVWYYRNQLYPGDKPADHDEHVAAVKANLGEPGRYKAFRAQTRSTHELSGSRLGDVRCPAVVLMGGADPDFPDPEVEARELAEALNAEVVMVDGVGHYPQAQAPTEVAAAIAGLIAGLG